MLKDSTILIFIVYSAVGFYRKAYSTLQNTRVFCQIYDHEFHLIELGRKLDKNSSRIRIRITLMRLKHWIRTIDTGFRIPSYDLAPPPPPPISMLDQRHTGRLRKNVITDGRGGEEGIGEEPNNTTVSFFTNFFAKILCVEFYFASIISVIFGEKGWIRIRIRTSD
jgi:hypothetical protein